MNEVFSAFAYLAALLFISCAWYGAEMMLYGASQSSIIDMLATAIFAYQVTLGRCEYTVGGDQHDESRDDR